MAAEERWDVIPGAESNADIAARVRPAIGAVLALATGSSPFAFIGSDNGAISRLVVAGPRWWLRGFNDRSRLERHSPRVRSV